MTSDTSTEDITRVITAWLVERERERGSAHEALRSEFDAVVERVRGLEARARETEARLEAAETQRDAMRAELEAALRTLEEEKKAMRRDSSSLPLPLPHSLSSVSGEPIPGLPGHLVVAHILGSDKLPDPTDLARFSAVSRGMRKAVAETKRTLKEPNEEEAVMKGYLSTVKHMHSRGRLSRKEALCAAAARTGQLGELKSLRAKGVPWNEWTCKYAARGGHLKVLKWARANGCPWDENTCWNAAWGGHLEVLKWARANGCPWDESTCTFAAMGGHLEVLKWARENGCPWHEYTCQLAARKGYVES
jgi:hypothetical protein